MKRLTRKSAIAAGACYDDDQIAALVPPKGLKPSEVYQLKIPLMDRLWALVYACGATKKMFVKLEKEISWLECCAPGCEICVYESCEPNKPTTRARRARQLAKRLVELLEGAK